MAREFPKVVRSETRWWRPGHWSSPRLFEFAVTKRGLKPKLLSAAGGTESGILRLLGGPPLVVRVRDGGKAKASDDTAFVVTSFPTTG